MPEASKFNFGGKNPTPLVVEPDMTRNVYFPMESFEACLDIDMTVGGACLYNPWCIAQAKRKQ